MAIWLLYICYLERSKVVAGTVRYMVVPGLGSFMVYLCYYRAAYWCTVSKGDRIRMLIVAVGRLLVGIAINDVQD